MGQNRPANWLDVLSYPVRLDIVRSLIEWPGATASELAAHSNTSDPTLRQHLKALVALGLVREHRRFRDGVTPGRPATRFSLYPHLRDAATALLEALAQPIDSWPRRIP
jgi:DNA-binding transcriptional ArsR family regulator